MNTATDDDKRTSRGDWPKGGEIHLVALDPTIGHEIQKTRPALVIQNVIVVAP